MGWGQTTGHERRITAGTAPASAHVVKAFNTNFGNVLAEGGRPDAFIVGDDVWAKAACPHSSRASDCARWTLAA